MWRQLSCFVYLKLQNCFVICYWELLFEVSCVRSCNRVAVKYYSDDWQTNSSKEAFEKAVFTKTQKTNARAEGNVDKKEALENLDLILLCLDEIVDGGSTFEPEQAHAQSKTDQTYELCCDYAMLETHPPNCQLPLSKHNITGDPVLTQEPISTGKVT
ncbi:hypothetical protein E3N88_44675 [Mikania micrantha]|uniref:Coatomer subunit zeta n=1 Tax=Mikania micrantha TaxID=192012 RepID=A0A5N6LBC3_9ASTR|nr:hypothetical protein E3N88_44675 [Mikania micrantha]